MADMTSQVTHVAATRAVGYTLSRRRVSIPAETYKQTVDQVTRVLDSMVALGKPIESDDYGVPFDYEGAQSL